MTNFSEVKKSECVIKKIPQGISLDASYTLVLQSVINAIKTHGLSNKSQEVCGVLVGNLCWDQKPYLLIDARIEGKFATSKTGNVTFTSETWDYIHAELAEKYPNQKIVGWYHTHPGFGIFLSNMDEFIHENFFSIKWQPAYVFDPQSEADGFFFWNAEKLEQNSVAIIADKAPVLSQKNSLLNEKKSVKFTDIDEKNIIRKRIVYVLVFIIFIIAALSLGIKMIMLHQHNKTLNEKILQKESRCKALTTIVENKQKLQQKQEEEKKYINNLQNSRKIQSEKLEQKINETKKYILELEDQVKQLHQQQQGFTRLIRKLQQKLEVTNSGQKKLEEKFVQAKMTKTEVHSVIIKSKSPSKQSQKKPWWHSLWPWNW